MERDRIIEIASDLCSEWGEVSAAQVAYRLDPKKHDLDSDARQIDAILVASGRFRDVGNAWWIGLRRYTLRPRRAL